MADLWTDLLACLDIASDADAGTFEGRNQQLEYHRVFGGQLLAQFIQIAALTWPDKAIKSQHAVFAREGRADELIGYEATLNHEGRSFAALTITPYRVVSGRRGPSAPGHCARSSSTRR